MRKGSYRAFGTVALLAATLLVAACEKKQVVTQGADTTAEPDKVLYDRAMDDIQHGRETVARFSLQTLLNTYPDSEYVAKAKLAIADSYYKEGTTEGLAQAVNEYKDFMTFFPYLDEASYAQYQVAMAHFRQMEKPDRDSTQVQLAEQEFQNYLLKYPQGAQATQVEQRLREVQEVIAEADYRVARYYYTKGSYNASAHRLTEIVDRYPLYSHSDEALWMLANSAERYEKLQPYATDYYRRIVRDYPLSPHAQDAKNRMEKAGVPIPQPNPDALARMQSEKDLPKQKESVTHKAASMFKNGPNVNTASHSGTPQMNPPGQEGGETLAGGGTTDIVTTGGAGGGSTARGGPPPVRTVTPQETTPVGSGDASTTTDPNATGDPTADAPKPPALPDLLPNHDDPNAKKRAQNPEESSSKKKKGLWKLLPF
ncbi:MAG TPA: outer membrane protein assembly factor BamD [Candidatus Acidoferrales bacterium]|nr:outer membrane protein assembly factor BamD [Candidatus Acidoferrales bacterium]